MRLVCLTLLALAANPSARAQPLGTVAAAFKDPSQAWTNYPTRTLENLPAAVREKVDAGLTSYGGLVMAPTGATGFFHTTKRDGRWWLVDPENGLCLYRGVAGVSPQRTPGTNAALQMKFGSKTNWAIQTTALLRQHGFIGAGAWWDSAAIRRSCRREPRWPASMSSPSRCRGRCAFAIVISRW